VIVSFSNELDIGKKLCSGFRVRSPDCCFIFNELATERKTMLKAFVSFFNELSIEKRNYARGFFLIMASKRIMLWKDNMSRDKTLSWLPRDLHRMGDDHFGRNTCRGS
jgi:hypothetical protein